MESIILLAFCLFASLLTEGSNESHRQAIAWTILGTLGTMLVVYALYIFFTGMYDLACQAINVVKRCIRKIQERNKIADSNRTKRKDFENSEVHVLARDDATTIYNQQDNDITNHHPSTPVRSDTTFFRKV